MDAASEVRLSLVHPKLAERIRRMADQLHIEGIEIRVTQGLRTWDEQKELYDQGRTMPGKIVTNAPPGHSYHNFGLAVDVAPFDEGQPNWDVEDSEWKRVVAVGEAQELVSGATWRTFPDWPHFQLTGRLPVSPDDATRDAFQRGGITSVWAAADIEA